MFSDQRCAIWLLALGVLHSPLTDEMCSQLFREYCQLLEPEQVELQSTDAVASSGTLSPPSTSDSNGRLYSGAAGRSSTASSSPSSLGSDDSRDSSQEEPEGGVPTLSEDQMRDMVGRHSWKTLTLDLPRNTARVTRLFNELCIRADGWDFVACGKRCFCAMARQFKKTGQTFWYMLGYDRFFVDRLGCRDGVEAQEERVVFRMRRGIGIPDCMEAD
jgi:hypothetical protein